METVFSSAISGPLQMLFFNFHKVNKVVTLKKKHGEICTPLGVAIYVSKKLLYDKICFPSVHAAFLFYENGAYFRVVNPSIREFPV
jgi:hypothetical protein